MWSNLFNTSANLTSFLRLFSDSFHIQANLVTLLQRPQVSQKHLNAQILNQQNLNKSKIVQNRTEKIGRQDETDGVKSSSGDRTPVERVGSPLSPKSGSISDRLKQPKMQQKLNEMQMKCKSPEPQERSRASPTNMNVNDVDRNKGVDFKLGKINRQLSDATEEAPTPSVTINNNSVEKQPKIANNNQSLKQRINNLVLKTLQENTGRDRQSMMNQNQNYTESWKVTLFQNTRVICNVRECQLVIDQIMNRKTSHIQHNGNCDNENPWPFTEDKVVVGFDCEGINLGVKGQLTLMQIATLNGISYVFDLISCPAMIHSGLKTILESNEVVKIIHDCRNDSANLYRQFNITLRNVFDTQAAHAVLTYQDSNKPVYKAKSVALNALCECYGAPGNPMKEHLKNIYRRDQKYWSRRPLTREMILYASADVLSLVHEKLYYPLSKAIQPQNWNLMIELCEEQIFMHINPDMVKMKKRQRKTETEVGELRVKLAQPAKSIVLSNREVRLLRYIELTDEEKEKLKSSVKVAKKLEKLENLGQDKDLSSDDEDNDYPSMDSDVTSPRNSEPTSLTESMQLVDSILSDNKIDRLDKLNKLEEILSVATLLQNDTNGLEVANNNKCSCAAHAVLTYQDSNKPVYKAKSVALNALCECYGAPGNPMKEHLKNIYRRDQKYWSRRPLTREMILYASADVLSLVHEKLYYPLSKAIQPQNWNLMIELCEEQIFMHINPDMVKMKKRQRKTETEVGELRVKLAQPAKSIVLSNREVRLLRYIELTDEEKEKLKSSVKVAKKLEKLENLGQDKDLSSDDEDNDYPSMDSDVTSPRNSEPTSLTESMQPHGEHAARGFHPER
ncbi:3prime-5prime exonuclease [Popillia japonica]|uniref:3prime-5prime exonuclease n=1 Tax=Popillia japonica TaxID=7064 RepID=A0AAW1JHK3_POPJA